MPTSVTPTAHRVTCTTLRLTCSPPAHLQLPRCRVLRSVVVSVSHASPTSRVAAPEARFSANFARLGFHHGFGLSATLPPVVGQQKALELLYTGRRIDGETAHAIGLADRLVPLADLRVEAHALAAEIAGSAPLAVASIRQTMRGDLAAKVKAATDRERHEQDWLQRTDDWREGVRAMAERRPPNFTAR